MTSAHTHPPTPLERAAGVAEAAAARRASIAAAKRRKRTSAQNIRSEVRTVARVNGDTLKLDANPNRAKRHAAKMANDPRLTPRQSAPGAPHGKRHYMPTLETSWARMPALGSHLSKRPLKGTSRG